MDMGGWGKKWLWDTRNWHAFRESFALDLLQTRLFGLHLRSAFIELPKLYQCRHVVSVCLEFIRLILRISQAPLRFWWLVESTWIPQRTLVWIFRRLLHQLVYGFQLMVHIFPMWRPSKLRAVAPTQPWARKNELIQAASAGSVVYYSSRRKHETLHHPSVQQSLHTYSIVTTIRTFCVAFQFGVTLPSSCASIKWCSCSLGFERRSSAENHLEEAEQLSQKGIYSISSQI